MKGIITKIVLFCLFFSASCSLNDAKKPGYEIGWLWTDMMYPIPYEPYSKNPVLPNGLTMQPPVEGTVHREAYLLDSAANPLPKTKTVLEEGAHLYQNFCVMCHGQTGKGDGAVAAKFLPPPDYQSERVMILSSGEIFEAITKGKGAMPAHAGQIDPLDRWKIVHYLQSELQGKK